MVYETRLNSWWFGALLAVILFPVFYFLSEILVECVATWTSKPQLIEGPLSLFIVFTLLILVARVLMVGYKMERSGKSFLAVILPTALAFLYYHFKIKHG